MIDILILGNLVTIHSENKHETTHCQNLTYVVNRPKILTYVDNFALFKLMVSQL